MTVVDYIDLDDDECFVEVDFVDLSTDEDSVEKDGNVPEDDNVARSENVAKAAVSSSISEEDAIPTMPLSKLEQEHAATASLSIVGHGAATSSVMEEEVMQPEHQKFLTTSDAVKEATRSENHGLIAAGHLVGEVMQSEHEQVAATSMLLSKQGAITSSLKEDSFMQFGNQVFVVALDHVKEATQSESTVKAAGSPSMTERGTTCKVHRVGQLYQMIGCPYIIGDGLDSYTSHGGGHPQGEPGSSTLLCTKSEVSIRVRGVAGNAMGSTGINNIHAQEKPDENCDFEAEAEALCQEVSQDVFAMSLSPQDKEKKIIQLRKFYDRKGEKQVNASATEHNRQLRIVHSNRVSPPLHNGNVLNGELVVSTYQGCRTSQGNTVHDKVHNNDSQGCMVEGCTNGAHGSTPLCVFHNSRPHKRCCAVVGCTKAASSCRSSVGRTDRCIKHGGGKRCKYDGCGKGAQGNTDYCITHGGGRRCKSQGCRKSAQGRSDYCVEHGGGRRCKYKYEGCSESRTCMKGFCSTHITCTLSGNNSGHEMLPEPAPACWAKKAERSKGRKSCSVAGERAQKRQNTNDYVLALEASVSSRRQRKRQSFIC